MLYIVVMLAICGHVKVFCNLTDTKHILYWTTLLSHENFGFPRSGKELFEKCQHNNCFATQNRSFLPSIDQFDALLFYIPAKSHPEKESLPEKRNPRQRYIFSANETPIRCFGPEGIKRYRCTVQYNYNNFYNWTMSYRFDSDIVRRYGYLEKRKTRYKLPTSEFLKNKTSMIIWIASNCRSANKREELVKRLQRYISVDAYGKCGNLTCRKDEDCLGMAEKKYKFYLSFENSNCRDYATEKLYRVLQKNIIPVVYGGGDYGKMAPPHSVINVRDFENVQSLANYLKYLAENEDKYLEYLEWKKNYVMNTASTRATACKLCEMLNDQNLPRKVYDDIHHWWFNATNSGCEGTNELPSIVA